MLVYTQRIWEHLYHVQRDDQWVSYSREFFDVVGWSAFTKRSNSLRSLFVGSGKKLLIVGSAFGFLAENFLDQGFDVWCVEPSPFVWANASHMRDDVRERTVNAVVGVDDVRAALDDIGAPRTFTYIIDDDAISSNDDTEVVSFIDALEDLHTGADRHILHLTSCGVFEPWRSPLLNWKELGDWEVYAPTHSWVPL